MVSTIIDTVEGTQHVQHFYNKVLWYKYPYIADLFLLDIPTLRHVCLCLVGGCVAPGDLVELVPHVAHALNEVLLDAGTHLPQVLIELCRQRRVMVRRGSDHYSS